MDTLRLARETAISQRRNVRVVFVGLDAIQTTREDIGANGVVTGTTVLPHGSVRESDAVPDRQRRAQYARPVLADRRHYRRCDRVRHVHGSHVHERRHLRESSRRCVERARFFLLLRATRSAHARSRFSAPRPSSAPGAGTAGTRWSKQWLRQQRTIHRTQRALLLDRDAHCDGDPGDRVSSAWLGPSSWGWVTWPVHQGRSSRERKRARLSIMCTPRATRVSSAGARFITSIQTRGAACNGKPAGVFLSGSAAAVQGGNRRVGQSVDDDDAGAAGMEASLQSRA